jgi:DNA (cytosine-5)-methyltransferase 1
MLLSVIEAAETLGCSAQYVRKLLREGRLDGEKVGDSWIISPDNIDNFDKKDLRLKKNEIPDRKSRKEPTPEKLNCLSFFSGAMGLDIGLEETGINVLLACEIDNQCRQTIVSNESQIGLIGDIREYSYEDILEYANLTDKGDIDIIVGGPPCQAFSTAGKRLGFEDERGNVFLKYLDLIIHFLPRYAVIENVRGLMSSSMSLDITDEITRSNPIPWTKISGSTLFYVKKKLELAGYKVSFNLYNSANFGTPQIRERVVIICTRLDTPVPHLRPTHSKEGDSGLMVWRTFRDAVQGLDSKNCDHINFSAKRLKYIEMLGPGENWRDLPKDLQPIALGNSYHLGGGKTGFYRRLAWDTPSPTVVTHPAMPATELAHPVENRPLSVQEYKRIQEFPDSWVIKGSILDQYKQIGNAVPVGLGRAIGRAIVAHYNGEVIDNPHHFKYSRYSNTSEVEFEGMILQSAGKNKKNQQLTLELF